MTAMTLPTDSQARKNVPLATGCLYYFPAALAEVAKLSKIGNDKHNPGQPLHHARGKSVDHADCILRHQIDVGTIDPDTGLDHAVMVAWRALAQLQELCEKRGAPLARGARLPPTPADAEAWVKMVQASKTPAGRFEAVQEGIKRGFITPQAARGLLDFSIKETKHGKARKR